jgi:2-hydroxy-6-oxo-octa-2,4-dienoate hydrolase
MDDSDIPGRGKTVSAFETQTNFHEAGEGRPVILLHGSGPGVSAWTNWRRVIPELARSHKVYAPDMAGFGFTERKPDAAYNIKNWVRHLLGFMDALGIESPSLVGNSFGGSLALAAASRYGDRFDKLILMGTPCDAFVMTPGLKGGWDYTPSLDNMRRVMSNFPYDPAFITDELVEERYHASLIPGAQEGLRKLLVKPNPEGDTPLSGMPESAVALIANPILVLHGREDRVIPVEMGMKIARAAPRADLHVFGRCGHWVQAERFDDFVSLSQRFLGQPS